jgi:hypothetical protein
MNIALDSIAIVANDKSTKTLTSLALLQKRVKEPLHDWLQPIAKHSTDLLYGHLKASVSNKQHGSAVGPVAILNSEGRAVTCSNSESDTPPTILANGRRVFGEFHMPRSAN